MTEEDGMAAPAVAIESLQIRHQTGSKRIKMNITNQFEKVRAPLRRESTCNGSGKDARRVDIFD